MNIKELTAKEINKKYKGRYIEVARSYDYNKNVNMYRIVKVSNIIRENMTLGEDLETSLAYCR